ncbi:MAG: 23S rRNA pseudouridine(1911/1915/1917) synthase RluD [Gammaproteobacteria bacterium]|nr:23S rRNA pseudouridine(1911/1915/1917) synthase RluD [Gammaproteobacteria bacterium]MBT8125278.1 23S rRNA pseudouridine(1911/1915/1917) synthase RluD [Gammaproteobacteria bacterium]
MNKKEILTGIIPDEYGGLRLDNALVKLFPDYSRARIQKWIKNGDATVNGKNMRPKDVVTGGENVLIDMQLTDEVSFEPEAIALDIVFEDDELIVINKPAGLIVHPGAGNPTGTMANALLHHLPEILAVPRVGIVHRLDKDTTGLLVVAKDLKSHTHLVEQLQRRTVSRKYIALVYGGLISGGTVDEPIGRHSVDRKRMAVKPSMGRPAITHYRIRKKFNGFTLLDVKLETGRTHQIRVHMAHIKFPIVGDRVYGRKMNAGKNSTLLKLSNFSRQALHAAELSFIHPKKQSEITFSAPLPEDFQELIEILECNQNES